MLEHVVFVAQSNAIASLLNVSTISNVRMYYISIGVPFLAHHSILPEIGPTQFLLHPFLVCLERLIYSSSVITDVRLDAQ